MKILRISQPRNHKNGKKLRGKFYVIHHMSHADREKLFSDLYHLEKKIFGNLDEVMLKETLFPGKSKKSYATVCINEMDEMVGFFSLQAIHTRFRSKNMIVIRGQTGLLKEYRRKTANIFFMTLLIMYLRLRYPFTRMYCILAVLNPLVYMVLNKMMYRLVPSPKTVQSSHDKDLIRYFSGQFFKFNGDQRIHLGLRTRFTELEIERFRQSKNQDIRYFLEMNPKFHEGYGLALLIPYSWKNILLSAPGVFRFLAHKTLRQIWHFNAQPAFKRFKLSTHYKEYNTPVRQKEIL